jgi:F-type H+-transporting ATPase subunit epsilon
MEESMADMKTFRLLVNTPDRVFYNDDVTMVELSTTEGEIGVYAEHIPLTSVLVPCVMNIHVDGDVKKAAVHGGIVEILQDKVTVLAEDAQWPDEIDVARAEAAKKRAEDRIAAKQEGTDMRRAEAALKRAVARIGAAQS